MDRLERLTKAHFQQIRLSKQTREKHFKESVKRMDQERRQREARRLARMNKMDAAEDRGAIITHPYKGTG